MPTYTVTTVTDEYEIEAEDFYVGEQGVTFTTPRPVPTVENPYPRSPTIAYVGYPIRSIILDR